MKSKMGCFSKILWLLLWIFIWVIVAAIVYICFCCNIEKNISIWEIVSSAVWALITVSVFYAWNQINKKKDNKDLLIQELWIIEISLKDMENIILGEFKWQEMWVQKSQVILQSKIKYIANKIEYISKQLNNPELLCEWNKFRDEVTEMFWWKKFKFDENYLMLFTKNYANILTRITWTKKQIIDW